jgi:hypothetical protein
MDYIPAHKHLEGWINYYINSILRGYLIRIPKFYDLKLRIIQHKFLCVNPPKHKTPKLPSLII